jgi:CheY-like chemotaxis protein
MQAIPITNILLAEDDEDDISLFKTVLFELNKAIIVTVATDGSLLMQVLQSAPQLPQIIFLDLNMPEKNGFECLREIRNNKKWDGIKIIILSTSSHGQQIETAYKGGADLYLAKPVSYTHFKNIIEKCLHFNWDDLKQQVQ